MKVRTGIVAPTRVGAWVAPAVEVYDGEDEGWIVVVLAAIAVGWLVWCFG